MHLATGAELLTIKDIAERISFSRSKEGIGRTLRQVRHWTQNDLLRTQSPKNTGKGIPRFYDAEPTLLIAALLLELSRYGTTVDMLKPVADELYEHWEDGGFYLMTTTTGYASFLQVAWQVDPETGEFADAQIHMYDELEKDAEDETGILSEPSSSIVVNMTKVLERIF